MKKRIIFFGLPCAVLFTAVWRFLPLTMNWSPSVPVGVYWMTRDRSAPYLVFCMSPAVRASAQAHGYEPMQGNCPDGLAWILKPNRPPVQTICFTPQGFIMNGRLLPNSAPLLQDRFGHPLPHYPFGTYRVSPQEVWVVSTYNQRSYDSRYFGPIPAASVVAYARPVLVAP